MSPGHGGVASFNNLISSRICPANERESHERDPKRERPGGARERADADGRRWRNACKLVLEWMPYDLGVIDAGNDPDSLRTIRTPMFLRP